MHYASFRSPGPRRSFHFTLSHAALGRSAPVLLTPSRTTPQSADPPGVAHFLSGPRLPGNLIYHRTSCDMGTKSGRSPKLLAASERGNSDAMEFSTQSETQMLTRENQMLGHRRHAADPRAHENWDRVKNLGSKVNTISGQQVLNWSRRPNVWQLSTRVIMTACCNEGGDASALAPRNLDTATRSFAAVYGFYAGASHQTAVTTTAPSVVHVLVDVVTSVYQNLSQCRNAQSGLVMTEEVSAASDASVHPQAQYTWTVEKAMLGQFAGVDGTPRNSDS
ncbi:hypothetical protein CONLIGDRAFT_674623 [Coniochaeta ligniaria NRRL 30616]|uniref:Uncharacterized protein n=1 Tax=Coniochaeta ligniaria NRRL 30616 TaxID=1408157 RepID=A0A1J7IPY6_9PEZI|nr:hypothetical protein CONLIGDRAFT_674623 [Coniochaeta ligniaria NRRL 30616]